MSKLTIVVIFLSVLLNATVHAAEPPNIGSGYPGLKVATRVGDANAIVIYTDEPDLVGPVGLVGMKNRKINVIIDHGFHFQKDSIEIPQPIPQQLYPFDSNSVFTSEIGSNDSDAKQYAAAGGTPPWPVGYRLVDGHLTVFTNVQEAAEAKYHLTNDEMFLGFVDSRIFFCKRAFKPAVVFWREQDSQQAYSFAMPRGVVDIFGVTRGIQKDVGFVVLRKAAWHLHPAPYEKDFIEIKLSSGKLMRPNKSLQATAAAPSSGD